MPAEVGGFINGETEVLRSFTVTGPAPDRLGSPPDLAAEGMPESRDFATGEGEAARRLMRFVEQANAGFQQYTRVARLTGETYLDGDEAARAAIMNVQAGEVR